MPKFRPRRPSGAMLVASVALFVALGGSSYAALTITSANIKNGTIKGPDIHNRTITGSKLKNNTLGGTEINESRLGTVPSALAATNAVNAVNATNATNAGNVNGLQLRKFSADIPPSTTASTVLDFLGVTLKAGCDAGSISKLQATNTSGGLATLRFEGVATGSVAFENGESPFDTIGLDLNSPGTIKGGGTAAVYRVDGVVVTLIFHWRNDRFSGSGCRIFGTATGG